MSRTYRRTICRKKATWLPNFQDYLKLELPMADLMQINSGKEYSPHCDWFEEKYSQSENINVYERRPRRTKEREIIQHIKHGEINPEEALFPVEVYTWYWW
tara:strand:+ start:793 stop:1095 length:303 start_codon:yes stop_codon:yes gene_type:complete